MAIVSTVFAAMSRSRVAIVRGERGHEPVFRALDLIDYKSALCGCEKVLIKVNFITVKMLAIRGVVTGIPIKMHQSVIVPIPP